jgi:hypothetical protein
VKRLVTAAFPVSGLMVIGHHWGDIAFHSRAAAAPAPVIDPTSRNLDKMLRRAGFDLPVNRQDGPIMSRGGRPAFDPQAHLGADPGIDESVKDVHRDGGNHDEGRRGDDSSLHNRSVLIEDGLDHRPP